MTHPFRNRSVLATALTACLASPPLFAQGEAVYVFHVPFEAPNTAAVTQGRLAVFPEGHHFGTMVLGATAATTATIKNIGQDAVNVTGLDVPAPYTLSHTCPASLQGGASCQLSVVFAPGTVGNFNTPVAIESDVAGAGTRFALSGVAVSPTSSLTITPNAVNLAGANVGMSAPVKSVTVTNYGNRTATVSGIGIADGAADFNQTNDCAQALAPGASCTINIGFSPATYGLRTANLVLFEEASGTLYPVALTGVGNAANLSVTPGAANFPNTVLGHTATQNVVLTNSGNQPLEALVVSLSGASEGFVLDSSQCGPTLAPGAACTVVVAFAPNAGGTVTDVLTVASSNGTPKSVTLTGTGVKGFASVSPGTLTYQPQQIGSTSDVQSVTVSNTGTSPLTLSGLSIIADGTEFAQSNNCATLAVGASCTVNVTFTPSAAGARSGTVVMTHDGNGLSTVDLNGQGRAQSASLSNVAFAPTAVGQSSTATATLTNTGVGLLSVTPPTATPPSGSAFSFVSTNCGPTLAVGATCDATLRFAPGTAGNLTGVFSLTTGAGIQSTSLSGSGVQGSASVTPTAVTFAGAQVASTSLPQTVTVTNTGTSALTFTGIGLLDGGADFAQSNNCGALAVGATCQVSVNFTPTAAGSRSGTLALTHDGSGVTLVSLSGVGQAASATLSAPSFAPTPVGTSSTGSATLTNTGIGALSVGTPTLSGSAYSLLSTTCASSLPVGANCVMTVRFAPTSSTLSSGTLAVDTGAGLQSASLGSTGIQGYASMSPSSLAFGAQQLATSSGARTVTVTNTGTHTLVLSGVGISAGATDYAQSNNCGTVPVNGTCTVNVAFTPASAGTRPGTLTFTHDGGGLAAVSLSGTGQAPSASLSSPAFPGTQVGQSSTATATLTNTGLAAISVTVPTSASVTGADFSFASTNCAATLAPAASCSVTVSFSATTATARAGVLTIGTSAGTSTANLSATGSMPSARTFSGNWSNFNVPQNTGSGHYVAVVNNGNGPLTVNSMSYTTSAGAFNAWMATSGGAAGWYCHPGFVLQPGEYCGAWSNGDGASNSVHSGTVTFSTSAGDVTVGGSLTVRGLSYSTATGAAVQATAGQSATVYNMTIFNNTQFDYYFPMYSVYGGATRIGRFTGANADKFVITGTSCPGKLAANTSCTVSIAATGIGSPGTYAADFQPNGSYQQSGDGANGAWANGEWLAAMGHILSDVYYSPVNPVNVVAQSAALSLVYPGHTPGVSSIVWGTVPVGQTGGSGVFTLTNTGNGPASNVDLRVPDGWVVLNNTCGAALAAGASCTFNLNFAPTVAKAYAGNFLPATSTGLGAVGYALRGTGQ
jgi:hypothetical protein